MTFFLFLEFCVIYFNFFMKIFEYFTKISMNIKKWLAKMCLKKLCIMNSLTFATHFLVSFDANKLTYDYFRPNDCFLQMISLEIQSFYSKNLYFYTYMFREIVWIICIHLFANNFIRWKMQTIFVCERFAKYNFEFYF